MALLGSITDLEWHGFLGTIAETWDKLIRPPFTWLAGEFSALMNAWFDWQVTVPQPVQDYIAAGTVLGLSLGRSNINNDVQQPGWSLTEHIINTAGLMLIGWLVCIFIWPIYLFTLPFFWLVWFATRSSSHPAERGHIVALLPLLYLALATLLNLWL